MCLFSEQFDHGFFLGFKKKIRSKKNLSQRVYYISLTELSEAQRFFKEFLRGKFFKFASGFKKTNGE
jgi:hypothetical protein